MKKAEKIFVKIAFVLLSLLGWQSLSAQTDNKPYTVEELVNIDSLNKKAIVVSMGYDAVIAIATKKGIVVIDAGISNSLTKKYRKIIEQHFQRNDCAYLINTHAHADHTGGNQVFADIPIIGHINSLSETGKEWKNKEKIKKKLLEITNEYKRKLDTTDVNSKEWKSDICQMMRYQYAYDDLQKDHIITVPTYTFKDSLQIISGDVTLNFIYFGKAHSESDIIIHIPELKLLLTGDLFFAGGRPSIDDIDNTCNKQWGIAIQWLQSRMKDIDVIIGGHGQIMTQDDLKAFIKRINKKQY